MSKIGAVVDVIGHYKYLITIVVGVLFVGVLCDTSALVLSRLSAEKKMLEEELSEYLREAEEAQQALEALRSSREAVERVAREKYLMKYPDEDVFVIKAPADNIDDYDIESYGGE